jgi:hypothetical protein
MNAMKNFTKKRKPYKAQQGGKKNGTRAKKTKKKGRISTRRTDSTRRGKVHNK